jgi:DNA polymerase-3 subunit gamma/tau
VFENILFQDRLIAQLTPEVEKKNLPPSLLVWGPPRSGKLTVALETARALSCEKSGAWNCTCEPCRLHRTLDYPSMLLTGTKSFLPEILAGIGLLTHHRTDARRFYLLRAVKKLVKRFDPVLWDGEENKLKPALSALESLQDDLESLYPVRELPDGSAFEKLCQRLEDSAKTLIKILPNAGIPIHQVRHLSTWARSSSAGRRQFVILENADRMQESARNALLKILEEPPALTHFFLLTSQKGAILPTILSRVRPLATAERTTEEQQKVLQALFHCEHGEYPDLKTYFQSFETGKSGLFNDLAETFLGSLSSIVYPLEDRSRFWTEENNFVDFLNALLRPSSLQMAPPNLPQEKFIELIQDTLIRREQFNLSASLLIETLFYKARRLL